MKKRSVFLIALTMFVFVSCNPGKEESKVPVVKENAVAYSGDTVNMQGFIAFDETSDKKRPVVLIVHEWWGLNDYVKNRARQLAEEGYFAMAVDMYGDGKTAPNPELAGKMALPFYMHPDMAKSRFDAALAKVKTFPQADATKIAAIGYCFGGAQVLNMARLGEDLKGVVSFHGNLSGVPLEKEMLKAPVLVCHGDSDKFVMPEEVAKFKHEMDSIHADYAFKTYPGATHAFTNPAATEMGKKFDIPIEYNAKADAASWKDMKDFFEKIFK